MAAVAGVAAGVAAGLVGVLVGAAAAEARRPRLEWLRFRVARDRLLLDRHEPGRLPPGEEGPEAEAQRARAGRARLFRMVHLSDLHLHRWPGAEHRLAARWMDRLIPHLVVVTGDVVDRWSRPGVAEAYLADLARRWQVALVWGNHDHERPARLAAIARAMERAGAWVLTNRRVHLSTPVGAVELIGVDTPDLGYDRLDEALARPPALAARWDGQARRWVPAAGDAPLPERPAGPPCPGPSEEGPVRVVAAHTYHVLEHGSQGLRGALVLVGDTHGGQVDLPVLGPVWARWVHHHRYVRGLYRVGTNWLYVNRGLGTIGVPLRWRCPPEVAVVDLVRPEGDETGTRGAAGGAGGASRRGRPTGEE